jgi:DNA-binding NtrC family response regulator
MLDLSRQNPHIVLVDDEQSELDAYSFLLESMGVEQIRAVSDSRLALQEVRQIASPIVFLDLNMPHLSGQDVLRAIKQERPQVPVIILTANSEIETAVECLKLGAHDYLVKPISMSTFGSALRNALEIGSLRNEVMSLKGIPLGTRPTHTAFARIVTQNSAMMEIFQYVEAIAGSGQPTLVLGETGSGKELIARAIHDVSGLPGDFVAVDVSGLDDTLFSDTLFGHARGAYTGADKARAGLLEKARDGTVFLDEIGDLSEVSQVKLLRLLQEGVYYPLGADQPSKSRARVVAAANKDLQKLAGQAGRFRMDLYYRLSTHLVKVPPLRARREDIPLLVKHLVSEAARSMNRPVPAVGKEAMHLLLRHPFHGNVRELKTYLFDAVARCGGADITRELIEDRLVGCVAETPRANSGGSRLERLFGQFPTLDQLADYAIDEAMAITSHNQSQAARLLGLSKQALHKRLKKKPVKR